MHCATKGNMFAICIKITLEMEGGATRHYKKHTVLSLLIAIISYLLRTKGQTLQVCLGELGHCQEHAAVRKPVGGAWEKEGNSLFRKGKKKVKKDCEFSL